MDRVRHFLLKSTNTCKNSSNSCITSLLNELQSCLVMTNSTTSCSVHPIRLNAQLLFASIESHDHLDTLLLHEMGCLSAIFMTHIAIHMLVLAIPSSIEESMMEYKHIRIKQTYYIECRIWNQLTLDLSQLHCRLSLRMRRIHSLNRLGIHPICYSNMVLQCTCRLG
jgi:hypothetical protein